MVVNAWKLAGLVLLTFIWSCQEQIEGEFAEHLDERELQEDPEAALSNLEEVDSAISSDVGSPPIVARVASPIDVQQDISADQGAEVSDVLQMDSVRIVAEEGTLQLTLEKQTLVKHEEILLRLSPGSTPQSGCDFTSHDQILLPGDSLSEFNLPEGEMFHVTLCVENGLKDIGYEAIGDGLIRIPAAKNECVEDCVNEAPEDKGEEADPQEEVAKFEGLQESYIEIREKFRDKKQALKELRDRRKEQNGSIKPFRESIQKISDELKLVRETRRQFVSKIKAIKKEDFETKQAFKDERAKLRKALTSVRESVARLKNKRKQVIESREELKESFQPTIEELKEVKKEVKKYRKSMKLLLKVIRKIQGKV